MLRCVAFVFVMSWVASAVGSDGPTNILPNGSFDEADGSLPAGWVRAGGAADSVVLSDDRPHSGARCIKLIAKGEPGSVRAEAPLPVEPATTYRLRYYFRIEESNLEGGQAMYVQARFLGADGEPLDWRTYRPAGLHTGGFARVSESWRMQELDFTVPEPARMIEVSVYPARGFQGIVVVDDVQILRLPRRTFQPPAGSLAFDFVAEDTRPTPGFTAVPFDRSFEQTGDFGWDIRPGTPVPAALRSLQPGYPTQLQGHAVRRATFSCALPNGTYTCSLYVGGLWRTDIREMNHVVEINGERVVDDTRDYNELMDDEYFRYVHATLVTPDDLERKGLAVYDRYIRPRYRRHDFAVEVVNARMAVKAVSGFMQAIIITPIAMAAAHEKAIAALDVQLAEEFAANWAELLPTDSGRGAHSGDYEPTARDQQRGYVIFRRHWMQAVEYDSRPDPEDVGADLALFATPGEYEPVTFSILPLKDLRNVTVTPTALRAEGGAELPADVVRVWYLQQKQDRRPTPATAYSIVGTFLPDWDVRELFKDIVQRCWLSIKVPEAAEPGVYRGEVRFAPQDAPAAVLNLSLRVMPFKLERPERLHVMRRASNQVLVPYPSRYPVLEGDVRNKQFYRWAVLMDLHEHGFAPEFSVWWRTAYSREAGRTDWDRDDSLSGPATQTLQLIKDSPFGRQDTLLVNGAPLAQYHLIPAFDTSTDQWSIEDTRRWLKDLSAKLAEFEFTKAYLHASAEESHFPPGKGAEGWIRFLQFVRENRAEWPNIFTMHTCNTAWGQPMAIEEADLVGLGMFHGVRTDAEEQVAMARASGKPFILYGCRGRMVPGYYLWKAGAVGSFHEFYGPYYGVPNNDWDNGLGMDNNARQVMNESPGWCNVTYSPTGRMIGSWFWEEAREGVDDDAYLCTLQSLIEETAQSKAPAVAAARRSAQQALSEIGDLVDLSLVGLGGRKGLALYRPFAPEDFDGLRWKAALAIAQLKAATEGKPMESRAGRRGKPPLLHRVRFEDDPAAAGDTRPPMRQPFVLRVRKLDGPITVDGALDEPCYQDQPQAASFIELGTGRAAQPPTDVYLFSDGRTLYVGIRCAEPRMSGLRMEQTEENSYIWNDDVVEIFLDPRHTHESYYHFGITPLGTRHLVWHPRVRQGGTLGDQTLVSKIWDAKAQRGTDSWTAEVAIPLADARIDQPCFGMSVCRSAPQHGTNSCWTALPRGGFHQPEANADVYLPDAPTVMERLTLGHISAGHNVVSIWVGESGGAAAVRAEMKAPGAETRSLGATRHAEANGLARYDAPYELGSELGHYEFAVDAGATRLGRYAAEYDAAFFNASLSRRLVLSGSQRPVMAELEMLVPPGAPLDGFAFQLRVLRDEKALKKARLGRLESRRLTAFVNIDDLPLGTYDLEVALLDGSGKQLKRTLSAFEVLPPLL